MRVLFTRDAWADYLLWQQSDREFAGRLNDLIENIRRSPFRGLGKPEPLKGEFQGWWSRRISAEHRLIYRIADTGEDQRVEIAGCRYHYDRR